MVTFVLMNSVLRYFLIVLGLVVLGFLLWYFSAIVTYILIAAVLSLIFRPLVVQLGRIKIGKWKIPNGINAVMVLLLIWLLFFGFFRVFVPLIASEANELSQIDSDMLVQKFEKPIDKVEKLYYDYNAGKENIPSIEDFISGKIKNILNLEVISNVFGSVVGLMGNLLIAVFSISFITFFLLKEKSVITDFIVLMVHEKHEEAIRNAMDSVRYLLMRYFVGLLSQASGIIILTTAGMSIAGIDFSLALVIGLIVGLINVIPYLGPYLGGSIGILLGVANNLHMDFSAELLPMVLSMLTVIICVQLTDNFLFQPLIFSKSVKAHPLEIFLVILIAGTLAGIPGMILGIPMYTVVRVFAKEFLSQVRVVKKLTRNI
ncbi:MAG TPA: AI-2E family transporter [Bacteroides sp.]|nr:AI-2E family transporter [Bacteroides sp.]